MDQLRQGELRAAFEQFKYAEAWTAKSLGEIRQGNLGRLPTKIGTKYILIQ